MLDDEAEKYITRLGGVEHVFHFDVLIEKSFAMFDVHVSAIRARKGNVEEMFM